MFIQNIFTLRVIFLSPTFYFFHSKCSLEFGEIPKRKNAAHDSTQLRGEKKEIPSNLFHIRLEFEFYSHTQKRQQIKINRQPVERSRKNKTFFCFLLPVFGEKLSWMRKVWVEAEGRGSEAMNKSF
jgi:hypothetical protein